MIRSFATLDVFTGQRLAGNPLAVVFDANGLDSKTMQALSREFNLPETVFVGAPRDPSHRAALRIFTPARELSFATHPTLGTAGALALMDCGRKPASVTMRLEQPLGVIDCAVDVKDSEKVYSRLRAPRLPEAIGEGCSEADCARALSLAVADIGFEQHRPTRLQSSTAYDLVPVCSLDALARAKPCIPAFDEVFGGSPHPAAYLYSRSGHLSSGLCFRARMFWPGPSSGIAEDPATASAATTLAGALVRAEALKDGTHQLNVLQGVEMGRPSSIVLNFSVRNGVMASAEIGGEIVIVSRGELYV